MKRAIIMILGTAFYATITATSAMPAANDTWTPHESVRNWQAVASSTNGVDLAAVVKGGLIYTSTDSGATWTPRESARNWISIASSSTGANLVAAVDVGNIFTSVNYGVTWTARGPGPAWSSVASSSTGANLVATVNGGQIYTSIDSGATWTARDSVRNWSSVASSSTGANLVATVNGGQIYASVDSGATWTAHASSQNWTGVASSSDGLKLVVCIYGGSIYTTGPSVSDPPTIGIATKTGATSATVAYTAPLYNGGDTITAYTAISNPGNLLGTLSQAGSGTITIGGLSPGTAYTFTVTAKNSFGASVYSTASNSVTTDATVPGAPTSVVATKTGATSATVSYSAPISNGGAVITSYTATANPGGLTGSLSQATSGTITINGLNAASAYTFTVKATNSIGISAASAASNSVITDPVAPGAPTIGVATKTGSSTATVAFTAPGSNGGSVITTYTATSSPVGGSGSLNQSSSGTITVTGLTGSTAYTFTVTATNSAGVSSSSSASNTVTTNATTVSTPPTIGSATATGQTTATVAFTAPGSNGGSVITSYTATSSPAGGSGTLDQAGGGTITVTGLTGNTAYTFTVTATNGVGISLASLSSNTITTSPVAPSIPIVDTATATSASTATVAFTAPGSNGGSVITSYTATSSPVGGSGSLNQSSSGTITVTGLTGSTAYTFTVTATNSAGTSGASGASNSITTVAGTAPAPPTIGSATTTGQTTATVAFTAPGSNGGSVITSYTATSSPAGGTGTLNQSASGTITVTRLSPHTAYTFSVTASNSVGASIASSASNSITTSAVPAVVVPAVVVPAVVVPAVVVPAVVVPAVVVPAVVVPAVATKTNPVTKIAKPKERTIVAASIQTTNKETLPISVAVPPNATTKNLTISISPVVTASEATSGFITIKILASDDNGTPITQFQEPLIVNLGKVAAGGHPSFSPDGFIWTPIQLLLGDTLSDGLQQGYYIDADGSTIILTRHLTYFGVKLVQAPLMLSGISGKLSVRARLLISVTGGSGDGILGFRTSTPDLCSISDLGQLTAINAGVCSLFASKAASGIYADAISSPLDLTISKAAPDAPTIGNATALSPTSVLVTFTPPAFDGGSEIIYYTALTLPTGRIGILTAVGSNAITVTGLSPGTSYSFTVNATNKVGTSQASEESNEVTTPMVKVTVSTTPTKIGVVYFGRSTSALDHKGYLALQKVLINLGNKKIKTIYLTGYTDATPGLNNKLLSNARAQRVKAYLIQSYIHAKYVVRAAADGYLVAPGRKNDQLNRRVEIWIALK